MASSSTIPISEDITNDAFHGTSALKAKTIVEDGFKLPDLSTESRYGRGIYFWQGSKTQAIWWAKKCHEGQSIAVIRAKIALGKHLNVISWDGQKIIAKVAIWLAKKTSAPAVTEAAVLNFMVSKGWLETALILDLPAQTRPELFTGSYSVAGARMILCVYSVEKILERSIVLEEAA